MTLTPLEKRRVEVFAADARMYLGEEYEHTGIGILAEDYGLEPTTDVIDALSNLMPDDVTIIKGGAASGYLHFERRK